MPIKPENKARYPKNWKELSTSLKEEANWQCQCDGRCNRNTHSGRCPNKHKEEAYGSKSIVILTTAHLNHTPEDCRKENLMVMCQGCHLHYDKEHHAESRRATKLANQNKIPLG